MSSGRLQPRQQQQQAKLSGVPKARPAEQVQWGQWGCSCWPMPPSASLHSAHSGRSEAEGCWISRLGGFWVKHPHALVRYKWKQSLSLEEQPTSYESLKQQARGRAAVAPQPHPGVPPAVAVLCSAGWEPTEIRAETRTSCCQKWVARGHLWGRRGSHTLRASSQALSCSPQTLVPSSYAAAQPAHYASWIFLKKKMFNIITGSDPKYL